MEICRRGILNIWAKDIEYAAVRQEEKTKTTEKDNGCCERIQFFLIASLLCCVSVCGVMEEDTGDRVKWRQAICCGNP